MKSFRCLLVLVLVTLAWATPASAWPYIDVTASETLSTDPLLVRTTFDLSFVGYGSGYDWFIVSPLDSATHLTACSAPAGWNCNTTNWFVPVSLEFDGMGAMTPVMTFSIVSDRVAPCVGIRFLSHLLDRVPAPTVNDSYDYYLEACLVLDAPVPARPASWGSVKSLYR